VLQEVQLYLVYLRRKAVKTLILVVTAILLAGCGGAVLPGEWERAAELCERNGGVSVIYAPAFDYSAEVKCENGAKFVFDTGEFYK